jgi:hypothetical protein
MRFMSKYLGDFNAGAIIDFNFNTTCNGVLTTLAGNPALSVYKSNGTTESTAGITLTVDFDSRTGMHHVRIDTSADGTFYAAGNEFSVVITTGTVSGTSVVGITIREFSIQNRSALRPTVAGRTINVDADGKVATASDAVIVDFNANPAIPPIMEKPESSSTAFRIEVTITDNQGNMKAPDSAPTIDVVNQAGTSRNLNLDSTTMTLVATGRYRCTYTVDTSHAIEQLMITISTVVGGKTRVWVRPVQVTDDQSAKIDAVHGALLTGYAEVTAPPAKGASLADKVAWGFHFVKDEVVTDYSGDPGTHVVKNDAGTVIGTATVSKAGSAVTKSKYA